MIVIQAKLIFLNQQDKQTVLDLMRRWSSCMRFAYKRLIEGYDRKTLKRDLQKMFDLNSRYVDDAIMKARSTLESIKRIGKSPRKVIFGGKNLFKKLQKRHINGSVYEKLKDRWQEKRKGNLYSRGDRSKKGNLNTRIEVNENGTFLRINVGKRKYVYVRIEAGYKKGRKREELLQEIVQSNIPYSVELKLKNGFIYAYFAIEEEYPEIEITKEKGVVGIDVNAHPDNISWVEVDEKGSLIIYGSIPMQELASGNSDKREYFRWQYAHKIVNIAKEKAIVIEVNPSYTSIIGMLKYAPQYMITKDVVAAYVIARRGLGLKEKIPYNHMKFLSVLTVDELEELKEHVKKTISNKQLKKEHLKEISKAVEILQSFGSEQGMVLRPLDGTSFSVNEFYRVLKVAVVTPLSSEKVPRNFSTLKELLIQGKWGDPQRVQVPASWGRGYGFPKYRLLGLGKSEGRTTNTSAI